LPKKLGNKRPSTEDGEIVFGGNLIELYCGHNPGRLARPEEVAA